MESSMRINRWSNIIVGKLAGAGFAMAVFALFLLYNSGFNLYNFSEDFSGPLWASFYVYGIVCSLLIQLFSNLFRGISTWVKIILYIFAGFLLFLALELFSAQGLSMFTIVAGTIGAICALIFYAGFTLSNKSTLFTFIFAIVIPLVLLLAQNTDFTVKREWKENSTDHSFEASFDYFNGKHEIPIQLEKGQTLIFNVDVNNQNGGGHGLHVSSQFTNRVPMQKKDFRKLSFPATKSGTYRIIVSGSKLKGSIKVNWIKENGSKNNDAI